MEHVVPFTALPLNKFLVFPHFAFPERIHYRRAEKNEIHVEENFHKKKKYYGRSSRSFCKINLLNFNVCQKQDGMSQIGFESCENLL